MTSSIVAPSPRHAFQRRLLRQILHHLRPYRGRFALALAQVGVLAGLELLKPWPLKLVLDNALPRRPLPWPAVEGWGPPTVLAVASVGLVLIYAALGITSVVNNVTTISIGQAMVNDLRARLYQHLQRLSLSFHARATVGDLMFRITADTYAIQTLAMNGLFPVLSATLLLVGMSWVMIRLDVRLTLVALAVCPPLLLAIVLLNRRIGAVADEARARESLVYQLAERGMSAIKVVQAFSREADEHRTFVDRSSASLQSSLNLYTLQSVFGTATNLLLAIGTAAVVWVGAQAVWADQLSAGELVVFVSYVASLYAPVNALVQTYGTVQGARAGLARVLEVLDTEDLVPDGGQVFATPPRGHVQFNEVTFGYDPGAPVLHEVSLDARPGELIAIVGATGAGKSTLVSLIPRFYDPHAGSVCIDGIDIRALRVAAVRQHISMVLQPPMVFPVSVRDNIAYGRADASPAAIENAARLAQAHDFILRLPRGYDTVLGEHGATLSEGERQRLTIARALLRDSPILILDEPTSSVDTGTEAAIMDALAHAMQGRTTFVIAHRLSTVRRATQIVVLDAGRIAERGTFEDLMARRGRFHALYTRHFTAPVAVAEP